MQYCLSIVCVAVTATLSIHNDVAAQSVGVKAGASVTTFSTSNDSDFNYASGFVGGAWFRSDIGPIGLQLEGLKVAKGAKYAGTSGYSISLDYFEVPLLVHIPFRAGRVEPYLMAGPAISFELDCEVAGPDGALDCDVGPDLDDRKKTDLSLAGGLGLEMAFGPGDFAIEARHTWGTTNNNYSNQTFTRRNRAIYLMAGYSVPLWRR